MVAADAEDITLDVAAAAQGQLPAMLPSQPLPPPQTDNRDGSNDEEGVDVPHPARISHDSEGPPVGAGCGPGDSPQPESNCQVEVEVEVDENNGPRKAESPAVVINAAVSDGLLHKSGGNADPEEVQPVGNSEETPSSADAVCHTQEGSEGGVLPDDSADDGESRSSTLAAEHTMPSVNGHAHSSSESGTQRIAPAVAALVNPEKAAEGEGGQHQMAHE